MADLADKIWITARVRIYSEKRYKKYDISFHIFLSFLSLLLIIGSVFFQELSVYLSHFGKLMITLSLLVFATSLIIYGFKFGEKSNLYRDCYLKLNALEQNLENVNSPNNAYESILECYPNHSDWDYHDFIISKTLFSGETITSNGHPIKLTWWMLAGKIIRFVAYWGFLVIPPVAISYLFVQPFFIAASTPTP
jgi:hypothetical protein